METSEIASYFQKPVVILDFETSKSQDNEPGIPIQIGCVQIDLDGNTTQLSKYVFQKSYEPEGDILCIKGTRTSIAELTGVYSSHLRSPEFADSRISVSDIVDLKLPESIIIGYNIPYDVRVLKRIYKTTGTAFPDVQIVDIMSVYIDLYGHNVKKGTYRNGTCFYTEYRLSNAAQHLGVDIERQKLHNALGDVELTIDVIRKIFTDNPSLDYSKYINKIYFNPCYTIPIWQRLQGVKYYPFGNNAKWAAQLFPKYSLYNV